MARLAAFAASLLSFSIVIFVLHCQEIQSAEIQESVGRDLLAMPGIPIAPVVPLNCTKECNRRCEVAGRQKLCLRFCNLCCNECHCVPSGHYGNRDECPCYRDKMNSKNGTKCP